MKKRTNVVWAFAMISSLVFIGGITSSFSFSPLAAQGQTNTRVKRLTVSRVKGIKKGTVLQSGKSTHHRRSLGGRIKAGKADKSLTRQERRQANNELRELKDSRKAARTDGRVSRSEKIYSRQKRKSVSHDIYSLRHNHTGKMGPRKKH